MIRLPAHATDASRRRAEAARRLIDDCPPALASEIALTGSTARGAADDDSDLELNLWGETIPLIGERAGWLIWAGASDIQVEDAPRPDDSVWIKFKLDDLPVEVGWQTFDALDAQIDTIQSGATLDQAVLTFGDVIASAIPLRGDRVRRVADQAGKLLRRRAAGDRAACARSMGAAEALADGAALGAARRTHRRDAAACR